MVFKVDPTQQRTRTAHCFNKPRVCMYRLFLRTRIVLEQSQLGKRLITRLFCFQGSSSRESAVDATPTCSGQAWAGAPAAASPRRTTAAERNRLQTAVQPRVMKGRDVEYSLNSALVENNLNSANHTHTSRMRFHHPTSRQLQNRQTEKIGGRASDRHFSVPTPHRGP